MRIIKSATTKPLSPIPKKRAIAAVPLSPNTLTSPLPSNRQLTTSHPSPKTVMLHEQQRMLQSMFELNQKNQKELFEYRKKDLDERQMKLEKEEKIRKERERQRSIAQRKIQNGSENQIEKMEHVRRTNLSTGYLKLGNNQQFLNYQKNSKEQQQYPYYWVNPCNAIHCHCSGNPPAKWFEESGCFRFAKYKTTEKKCCLYIPVRGLQKQMLP